MNMNTDVPQLNEGEITDQSLTQFRIPDLFFKYVVSTVSSKTSKTYIFKQFLQQTRITL
jgi:hypothetical protein